MRHRTLMLYLVALAGITLIAAWPVSSRAADKNVADDSGIELFDSDVERNQAGWPRFQVAAGMAKMDADGADFDGPMALLRFRF